MESTAGYNPTTPEYPGHPFVHLSSCMKEKCHAAVGLLLFSSLILHGFLCAAGEDDAPAGVVELACWFLCDFPGLLLSGLGPCCRTFTPRIICEI
jgi:hypothetical protein